MTRKTRTNNMYLNLMYSLLEMAFEHGSERLAITILIKLDLIIRMQNAMGEIYKNGVLLKELHIDNLLFFFRRVVKLIEKLQVVFFFLHCLILSSDRKRITQV